MEKLKVTWCLFGKNIESVRQAKHPEIVLFD